MSRTPTDTDPITLKEASEIIFNKRVGVAALRSEAVRGRLSIFRIGGRDFTTIRDVREMVEKCRVEKHRPASTMTKNETRGLSVTERDSFALASIANNRRKLKAG